MLRERVLTAILLIASVLAVLFLSNMFFFTLVTILMVGLMLKEWYTLSGHQPVMTVAIALGTLIFLAASYISTIQGYWYLWYGAWFTVWLSITGAILTYPSNWWQMKWLIGLWASVSMGAMWFYWLFVFQLGKPYLIILIVALISISDSCAYAAGKLFGKHKLIPAVSPKKSWEGLAAGMLVPLLLACIFMLVFGFDGWRIIKWLPILFLSLCGGLVGDLFISLIKRAKGLKDTGNILPGHGGVLDRLDSFMGGCGHFMFGIFLFMG